MHEEFLWLPCAHLCTRVKTAYISDVIPGFLLGREKTLVPRLSFKDAEELIQILFDETVRRQGGVYRGKHIAYISLPKHLRGSDRSERLYAAVKLLMYAGLTEAQACRTIAEKLGPRLGNSKRGRPVEKPSRHRRSKAETVRALFHSFESRNPWRPSEDSANFVDVCVEKWFSYAWYIGASRRGMYAPWNSPPGWKATWAMVRVKSNPRARRQRRPQ